MRAEGIRLVTDGQIKTILITLQSDLSRVLGNQVAQVMLYGSHVRGEARPDSDIDVLLVMNGEVNYPDLMRRTSAAVAALSLEHDVVISRTFVTRQQFAAGRSPFLIAVRREAVAL